MKTFILIMYLSSGFGQYKTGGPMVVDNITTEARCETIAQEIKSSVGGKYDWHICQEVDK